MHMLRQVVERIMIVAAIASAAPATGVKTSATAGDGAGSESGGDVGSGGFEDARAAGGAASPTETPPSRWGSGE